MEYVNIYEHKCFITSEEEKCFKRHLRKLRKLKKEKEKLAAKYVGGEGLQDEFTQTMIDGLMKQRKRKVQDLEDINKGIPMEETMRWRDEQRMENLRERVMKQLVDKGVELDAITTEMIVNK